MFFAARVIFLIGVIDLVIKCFLSNLAYSYVFKLLIRNKTHVSH